MSNSSYLYTYILPSVVFLIMLTFSSSISLNRVKLNNDEVDNHLVHAHSPNLHKTNHKTNNQAFDLKIKKRNPANGNYMNHLRSFHQRFEEAGDHPQSLLQLTSDKDLYLHKSFALYVGDVNIGMPPQKVSVTFDTGSGFNWVASNYCKINKQCILVENFYNHTISKTKNDTDVTVGIKFGTGELLGNFVFDSMSFLPGVISASEPIGEIFEIGDHILFQAGISGIIGLAYNGTSYFNHTAFDGLVESGTLLKNTLGFYMKDEEGEINFGYTKPENFEGPMKTHKVIDPYYWTIGLDEVKIAGKPFCDRKCRAVIDTGSSGLVVPVNLYQLILKTIDLHHNCTNARAIPPVVLTMDGEDYTIDPDLLVYEVANPSTGLMECSLNMVPIDLPRYESDYTFVLGDNFLKKFYTVFDRDNDSVNIALNARHQQKRGTPKKNK